MIGRQLQLINDARSGGNLTTQDLLRDNLSFGVPTQPLVNIYPTARVDFQVSSKLSVRGVINAHYRDLAQNPQFPGMDRLGGFDSTYYILSAGADWTPRQNLVSQLSIGTQQNPEVYNKTNTLEDYAPAGNRRITLPLNLTSAYLTGALRFPRDNPVFNISDTLTWLKGRHTFTFGGTYRQSSLVEPSGGEPETFTLGVAAGDPVSSIFNANTMPGLRAADQANVQALYALLTGRLSQIAGVRNIDEETLQYGLNQVVRREAARVGGVYAQDSWRLKSNLTLNYGLRWEMTGAAHNTNDLYASPTVADIFGPSTAPFRPGVLDGVQNPSLVLNPTPYKADLFNFAPNVGAAWSPEPKDTGFLHKLLGRSVIRGNFGMNYYDEGGQSFSTAAGNNPGLIQNLSLLPGQPGFTPGGLSLSSAIPPLVTTPALVLLPDAAVAVHVLARLRDDRPRDQDAVHPELEPRHPARVVARFRHRSAVSRQRRTQPLAQLRPERDQHLRERIPRRFPARAAQPADQPGRRRRGLRQQWPARPGGHADLRRRLRRAGRPGRARPRQADTPTARSSRCSSRGRRAGSPTPWRATRSTCAAWSAATWRHAEISATRRAALTRSTSSR